MTTRQAPSVAALTLLAALAIPPAAPAQTRLRWKFADGMSYAYTLTQETRTSREVMGQKLDSALTQVLDMTWAVRKVQPDGSARISLTIDRVRASTRGPGGDAEFDSKDPGAAPPQFALVRRLSDALVGQPVGLMMSARGRVEEVELPEKLADTLKAMGPPGVSLFSAEGFKNLFFQSSPTLPEEALEPGDTWKASQTLGSPPAGTKVIDTTYTFRGPAPGGQKIEAERKVRIESRAEVAIKSQKNGASFLFDDDAGMLRSSEVVEDLTVSGRVMGQESLRVVASKSTLKLADDPAPR